VVHHHALAFQQDAEAPRTEPTPLLGQLAHLLADVRVVGRPFPPHRLRIDTDEDAGAALLRGWADSALQRGNFRGQVTS
jgi:hypothetical protein